MLIRKSPHKNLIWLLSGFLITGCSTQIEERASIDFEPIMPSESKIAKKDKYGSIYSNSQIRSLLRIDEHLRLAIY